MAEDKKSNIVMTPEFRVAFAKVFTPEKNRRGNDEYSLVAIFPAGADLSAMKVIATAALEKKFGADKAKWPKGLKNPFRDGADRAGEYEGFEAGMTFVNLKSKFQPRLVDERTQPIINQKDFYSGCWARATVNAFAYDTDGNKGVSFGLNDVQKTKDDKPFAGRPDVKDVFTPVAGTAAPAPAAGDDFLS